MCEALCLLWVRGGEKGEGSGRGADKIPKETKEEHSRRVTWSLDGDPGASPRAKRTECYLWPKCPDSEEFARYDTDMMGFNSG